MSLEANDCHNLLKLKIKAQVCYFLLFLSVFFSKIKSVKFIHVLGLSFSPVDIDYMNWIYDNTLKDVKWEVSWYSDEDKTRIANFVLDHWNLKNRCSLIKLTSVDKRKY